MLDVMVLFCGLAVGWLWVCVAQVVSFSPTKQNLPQLGRKLVGPSLVFPRAFREFSRSKNNAHSPVSTNLLHTIHTTYKDNYVLNSYLLSLSNRGMS
jgi:hypothetical protein